MIFFKMKRTRLSSLIIFVTLTTSCIAQNNEELFTKAQKFKSVYNYREALPLYQSLLKGDSSNVNYLTGASYCMTKFSFYYSPESEKIKYYTTAGYLAQKAIKLIETNAEGHYVCALALGRIYENASSKVKIANAKAIKTQLDRSITLNPKIAGAHHILGRWHRTIAGFSAVEKMMINSFFGGVPEGGSYQDAVKSFMTAISIEPKFMLHQYELAETYYEMGKLVEAKLWAQKALEIIPTCEDDNKAKKDTEALLKKLK